MSHRPNVKLVVSAGYIAKLEADLADSRAAVARLRSDNLDLRGLLAVMNGDGGQHQDEVGIKQAIEDALTRYYDNKAEVTRLSGVARLAQMQSDQAVCVADELHAEVTRLGAEVEALLGKPTAEEDTP